MPWHDEFEDIHFCFLCRLRRCFWQDSFRGRNAYSWGHGAPGVVGRVSHLGCWSLTLLLRRASCDPVTRIAVIETGDRSPTGTIAASTDIQLRESTAPMAGREGSSARLPRTSQTTVTEYVAERCDVSNHTLNRELALRMTPLHGTAVRLFE